MGFAIFTFCVVFLLIVSGGLLLFYREEMLQRISEAINPQQPKQKSLMTPSNRQAFRSAAWSEHFENVLPKSAAEVSIVTTRLQRAGYRDESAVKIFYGSKVLVPLLLCVLTLVFRTDPLQPVFRNYLVSWPGLSDAGFLAGKAN